ncbi:AraC family transcriptional regulator [Danxiaibacter flavus]|uniref:AraC family transcriptional regulator n=1 Tax=Danxiaibacter flavus TaxID=3049108 RepID=A0ABV3ZGF7_9BACT|nr:AraC family transcriptional regulator [Chitinophagaceae bacterium DXS]
MKIYQLPDDFSNQGEDLFLHYYESGRDEQKNKVTFNTNLFSFLLEGEKISFYPGGAVTIGNTQGILIRSGNCLMTEHVSVNNKYRSVLLFFTDKKVHDFIVRYKHLIPQDTGVKVACPVFPFEKNVLLTDCVRQLEQILLSKQQLSGAMLQLKFEEIMLCILEMNSAAFVDIFIGSLTNRNDVLLREVVETNINNNLSLQELAFLCNTSLSTFKRQFEKIYGIAPSKWIQEQRMQQAAFKLKHERVRPSDIYFEYGYENLSGFIQAFKKEFGKTPGEYVKLEG